MILETERLTLHRLSFDDFDALYAALADSDNIYTRVYAITREEWEQKSRGSHNGNSK